MQKGLSENSQNLSPQTHPLNHVVFDEVMLAGYDSLSTVLTTDEQRLHVSDTGTQHDLTAVLTDVM